MKKLKRKKKKLIYIGSEDDDGWIIDDFDMEVDEDHIVEVLESLIKWYSIK